MPSVSSIFFHLPLSLPCDLFVCTGKQAEGLELYSQVTKQMENYGRSGVQEGGGVTLQQQQQRQKTAAVLESLSPLFTVCRGFILFLFRT